MAITQERKNEIIKEYRVHETDTGSPEVQIAVLTAEIAALNEHLREHKRPPFTSWIIKNGRSSSSLIKLLTW